MNLTNGMKTTKYICNTLSLVTLKMRAPRVAAAGAAACSALGAGWSVIPLAAAAARRGRLRANPEADAPAERDESSLRRDAAQQCQRVVLCGQRLHERSGGFQLLPRLRHPSCLSSGSALWMLDGCGDHGSAWSRRCRVSRAGWSARLNASCCSSVRMRLSVCSVAGAIAPHAPSIVSCWRPGGCAGSEGQCMFESE